MRRREACPARPDGVITVLGIESSCDDTAAAVVRWAGALGLACSAGAQDVARSASAMGLARGAGGGEAAPSGGVAQAMREAGMPDAPRRGEPGGGRGGAGAFAADRAAPKGPHGGAGQGRAGSGEERSGEERSGRAGSGGERSGGATCAQGGARALAGVAGRAPGTREGDGQAAAPAAAPIRLPKILSQVVASQEALHAAYGGVVPEIAARAHAERLDAVTERALREAGMSLAEIDAVAVTAGPGLLGGVVAGVAFAKGLAAGSGLPLVGVNHLAGHALTPRLTDGLAYPYLVLLVSGGHCQLLIARAWDRFERLGGTIDDAPGEAFDKVARELGLSPPGGPAVEREARRGDPSRFALPRPLLGRAGCDMSFSGLKTAVLRARDGALVGGRLPAPARADLCAAFQAAVRDVLADRAGHALERYLAGAPLDPAMSVVGGVAANRAVRAALADLCAARGVRFAAPPPGLCTDNAAMIAWAGIEARLAGRRDGWDLAARPRWPLDAEAPPMLGSGRKGAKA